MVSRRLLAGLSLALLGAGVNGDAVASASMTAGQTRYSMKLREVEHKHRDNLKKIMSKITTDEAMQELHKKANHTVTGLVLEALSHRRQRSSGSRSLRASQDPVDSGYSGVDKAKNMLNSMIEETQKKYDMELQTCCDYDSMQSKLIEGTRQDISGFNAEAAEARKEVLDAQNHIEICETKLPILKDTLNTHNRECDEEQANLEGQLKIIKEDLSVMAIIIGMINCDKPTSLLAMNCKDQCTGEAFMSVNHTDIHNLVVSLKSDASRELLSDNVEDDSEADSADDSEAESEAERADSEDGEENATTTWGPPELPSAMVTRRGPCKTPVPEDKRTGKCSINQNPNCDAMKEKFLVIESGIEDKRDELQEQLGQLLKDCKTTRDSLEAQISYFEGLLQDQLTQLAGATKKQNNAEEGSRQKNAELVIQDADYEKMTESCHTNYETLEGEECGLKKIRSELYKMKGQDHPAFFEDCVVSDWIPGECSLSCGGGTLTMTRSVVTAPVGGAACPALEEVKKCNEDACPIDCKLGDWSGWSECTGECGGGITQRGRDTLVEPMHGGIPCAEPNEAKSCKMQACDTDCDLSDWTEWGKCSKACNSGESERVKTIVNPASGKGKCDSKDSKKRFQSKPCNEFQCKNSLLGFKYFKFTPMRLRNARRANSVQVAEFTLHNHGGIVPMDGFKATNPGGKNPKNEEPDKAVDGNAGTKWLDFNKKALIIEAPQPVEADSFQFSTANDATARDPMQFKMEGSNDKNQWTLLHWKRSSRGGVPSSRYAGTSWFPFPVEPLKCGSELDVILVLDGSGSLGRRGWAATVKAATMLANSFLATNKVQLAILLFSRSKKWVQQFSSDRAATIKNIQAMKWPKGRTMTANALNTAAVMVGQGRDDAQTVVVVITDGKPRSKKKTGQASTRLRKKARLMYVPVTRYAPLRDIKKWASEPKKDNIVSLRTWEALSDPSMADTVVSDLCPDIS